MSWSGTLILNITEITRLKSSFKTKIKLLNMKKLQIILALIALVLSTQAQIVKEHEYINSANYVKLALSGEKYYALDWTNNKCIIYNLDHSIWKSINLAVPAGMYLYDIRHVSETLFNLDSKIELAYIYYEYDTIFYYYTYAERIINEDGLELLPISGAAFSELQTTINNGTKLLAWIYDYSVNPYIVHTAVYSVPGQPVSDGNKTEFQGIKELAAYPNPAQTNVSIPYTLPQGISNGVIEIIDFRGINIQKYQIGKDFSELKINTAGWPRGIYIYRIIAGQGYSSTGKLIID